MSSCLKPLLVVFLCMIPATVTFSQEKPEKFAVLIGINKYQHPSKEIKSAEPNVPLLGRDEPGLTYEDLKGPGNDVSSMRQVLIDKFEFSKDPVHMAVLLDEEAKHDAIMRAMQHYLVDAPKKGDTAVLFVSSHGSLRIYKQGDGDGDLYNLLGDPNDERHAENTIVPYDWNDGVDDIFSRDLRHIYRQAVDKGVHVVAIFDSCHSGDLGRGLLSGKLVPRDFDFDPREMKPNPYAKEERPTLPQNDPVTPVLILSATQKDQLAIDDQTSSPAHGVFTSALVEALNALPTDRTVSDVFSRLQISMELAPHSIHQQPEMDTSQDRQREPTFGGPAANGPSAAVVESVAADGSVLLNIGIVADIGPGSLFATMPEGNVAPVVLKVAKSEGVGRSLAEIVTPGGAVTAKELVQLKAAVPWQRPDLLVYAGASNPGSEEVQNAVDVVKAANLTLALDPSQDPWNYHLYWDGTLWMLKPHSQPAVGRRAKIQAAEELGVKLNAKALGRVPAGSAVWFDPPLPREVATALLPPPVGDGPHFAAHLVTDRTKAMYVIGARLTGDTVSYAWFKRSDVDAEVQTPQRMGPGCSPGSSYPLRTEWFDQTSTATTAEALNKYVVRLAKLNGWFLLESSPLSEHQQFPYTLALRPAAGGDYVVQNGTTYPGGYDLYLIGTPKQDTTPQWVYVLNIDCEGNGHVVWPYEAPRGKTSQPARMFPVDDANKMSTQIKLPGYPFPVKSPLGTDTYMLLTTSTRLSDYHSLNFDGVVSKGATGNPLEDLLDDASGGTRLAGEPIPTDWGIWTMQLQSLPGPVSDSRNILPK